MKPRTFLILAASFVLLAVAFMLGSMVSAQSNDRPVEAVSPVGPSIQSTEPVLVPDAAGDEAILDSDSGPPDIPADGSNPVEAEIPIEVREEDPQPLAPGAVTVVNDVVQVQGRLTAPNGFPVNGNQTITVSIYDVAVGGTARCTDADTVSVTDGLFTMAMDFCSPADFNGDALFMGIKVGADPEMTPRQEIFSVPYAWALRPGAIVKGADSVIFVPGNALVKNLSTDTTRWDIQANGAARIWRGATVGTKVIYLPITLPGVLYGQNVTVKQITVYYKTLNGGNSYITETDLWAQTDADSWIGLVQDLTDRTSTTASGYTLTITQNNVLSNTQGILGLFFYISFANDTDYLQLGGVRVVLGHQ